MIQQAVDEFLGSQPARKESGLLYVSDLGAHPYKAMARILKGETAVFDTPTRLKMAQGSAYEDVTLQALRYAHRGVQTQFPLYNEMWSGYADFVVGHGTQNVTIIEHKGTGDKWFDYKQSLPRSAHVCQLWMYGYLYEAMYHVKPKLILYYAAWGIQAEFEVFPNGVTSFAGMVASGFLNGQRVERIRVVAPDLLRQELEYYFETRTLPDSNGADDWDYAETYLRTVSPDRA